MQRKFNNLRRRALVLRQLRTFFDNRGFVEVQTPLLSADSIADRFVDPLTVCDATLPNPTMYLQTSPELAMKRLLAMGLDAIYQIGPVFRCGDRGRLHNVEFTMLEWYRIGDGYEEGMELLSGLIAEVLGRGPAERRDFGQIFQMETGFDPHTATPEELQTYADAKNIAYPASFADTADVECWVDLLFSERVQPFLGLESPILVQDFPVWQGQMAKVADGRARRFELFVDGIELANGYDELTDPAALQVRNETVNAARIADGRKPLPQEKFLNAVRNSVFPPCSGCALGVDRLVMLLCGAQSIDEVLAFPIEEA